MTFYIYRSGNGYELSDGENVMRLAHEASAIDAAVRIAQALRAVYEINYWPPVGSNVSSTIGPPRS